MHQLIPDFIQQKYSQKSFQGEFDAVGMFVDLSGFTAMTEDLMQHGPHGAEVLAGIIRQVFEPLVRSVYDHGGFISSYAGDAFTALFTSDNDPGYRVGHALTAATKIRTHMQSLAIQLTEYGAYSISGKVGLACGKSKWGIIQSSDKQRATYYFRGDVIEKCAAAQELAAAGEIIADMNFADHWGNFTSFEPAEKGFRIRNFDPFTRTVDLRDHPELRPEMAGPFFPKSFHGKPLASEFRQVVNLFVGFPMHWDHGVLQEFMQLIFNLQSQYGGTFNHLDYDDKGANLLVFWGAPLSYENDIERALDFVLALSSAMRGEIKAGITYHIAHAGMIGSELREEYTCLGRGVNLAARLMASAQVGEILLDDEVSRRCSHQFEVEQAGERPFKGFKQKQRVHLLKGKKAEARELFQGKLVGREKEMQLLERFISPIWESNFAGMMLVLGEPGIGKSRLVHEFIKSLEQQSRDFAWALCQTDEILRKALNPFRYWLRQYFDITRSMSEEESNHRVDSQLDHLINSLTDEEISEELHRVRPFLKVLVDVTPDSPVFDQLDPQARYENSLIALTTLIKAESMRQKFIVLLEDFHWLDEETRSFLPRLIRSLTSDERRSYPVAILATSRYEGIDPQSLGSISDHLLDMESLPREGLALLIEEFLGTPASIELLNLVIRLAGGNPFFAEQIVRYLQEEGLLVKKYDEWEVEKQSQDSPLPSDVRAVLVARLDRLSREIKDIVQTASVLGREFELNVLSAMLRDDEALPEKIFAAENAEIWLPLSELRYLFKHALLRDAAYRMQLRVRRQELHALAFDSFEKLYAGRLHLRFGELAYHSEKARMIEKARYYLPLAADAARNDYQNSLAIDYFSRALELISENDLELLFDYLMARESLFDLLGNRNDQLADIAQLESIGNRIGTPDRLAKVGLRKLVIAYRNDNYTVISTLSEEALKLANKAGLIDEACGVYRIWAMALARQGKYEQALKIIEQGLGLARQHGNLGCECQLLNTFGLVSLEFMDPASSRTKLERSLQIAREIGDLRGQAQALNNLGIVSGNQGELSTSAGYYEQSLAIARKVGDRGGEGLVLINLGWIAGMQGDYPSARSYTEQSLRIAREVGSRFGEAYGLINLSLYAGAMNDIPVSLSSAEQGRKILQEIGDRSGEAWSLTCLGHAYLASDQLEEASRAYQESVEIRRQLDQPILAAEPLAGLARIALRVGDPATAQDWLAEIIEHLLEGKLLEGTDEPLRVYQTCFEVLSSLDDPRKDRILADAYKIIQQRAAKIHDSQARRRFLTEIPHNREILAAWEQRDS